MNCKVDGKEGDRRGGGVEKEAGEIRVGTRHTPIYLAGLRKDCRYLSRSVGSLAFARFLIRHCYALTHSN
jgi:hypothetical protein